ncbi:MAG: hypothetical protein ACE5KX_00190 [Acidimicrobiia bacterium]
MIRRLFNALPGPTPARLVISAAIVAVLLVALILLYEWVGSTFLDTGGTVG